MERIIVFVMVVTIATCRGSVFLGNDAMSAEVRDWTVELHNHYRSRVHPPASDMLRVTWDDVIADDARRYSEECRYEHRTFPLVGARELNDNLYVRSRVEGNLSHVMGRAVGRWFEEGAWYDYVTMTCEGGRACGHYTQLVWASTINVGCAVSKCANLTFDRKIYPRAQLVVCSYAEAGNYRGERPYVTGTTCSDVTVCITNRTCVCAQPPQPSRFAYSFGDERVIGGKSTPPTPPTPDKLPDPPTSVGSGGLGEAPEVQDSKEVKTFSSDDNQLPVLSHVPPTRKKTIKLSTKVKVTSHNTTTSSNLNMTSFNTSETSADVEARFTDDHNTGCQIIGKLSVLISAVSLILIAVL